jgi:hypothetical protein
VNKVKVSFIQFLKENTMLLACSMFQYIKLQAFSGYSFKLSKMVILAIFGFKILAFLQLEDENIVKILQHLCGHKGSFKRNINFITIF